MKSMMIALISLTAVAAMATQPAAPAAPTAAATTAQPSAKQDCTKMTGEAKTKCEAEMKAHK